MEKKLYILPIVRVKKVELHLMQDGLSAINGEGSGDDLSKEIIMPEDNGNEGISRHDIWED